MALGLAVLATAIGIHVWTTRRADDARYAHAISDVRTEVKKPSPRARVGPSLVTTRH